MSMKNANGAKFTNVDDFSNWGYSTKLLNHAIFIYGDIWQVAKNESTIKSLHGISDVEFAI